jgi:hypothetical protein
MSGMADTDVARAWMTVAKSLHQNGVPHDAIHTFSDDLKCEDFEDDEEVAKAASLITKLHDKTMEDYLKRAGYQTNSSHYAI